MWQILVLTTLFIVGALVGMCLYEGANWMRQLAFIGCGAVWYLLTYYWWATKLFKLN